MGPVDFNKIFDEYNEIMIFASSNKLKLSQMEENGLPKDHQDVVNQKEFIEFQLSKIDSVLDNIDDILSDYYQLDIQIEPHELNGMEQDLLGVKKEYMSFLEGFDGLK